MDAEELAIRQRLKDDFQHYARKCLSIRSKEGKIEFFDLNKAQKYVHARVEEQRTKTGKIRCLVLKGRQQGISTYIEGRFYWRVTHTFGMRAFILTHEEEATQNLFEMAQRYHENCPHVVKPKIKLSNAKELVFADLDSGYKLGTAGNKSVGRSSTIQFLHASEAAFYKHADEHAKGIMQTVPDADNTEIFIESTANGLGNWFHEQWQLAEAGLSDFIAIFVPWYWQDEYVRPIKDDFKASEEEIELKELYGLSDEQLNWRRNKIVGLSVNGADGSRSFRQEYPCIVGSQRVGSNYGILPIKEIHSGYNSAFGFIKKQWCTGMKETIQLETDLGYTLECTLDHLICCADGSFLEASKSKDIFVQLAIPRTSDNYERVEWNVFPCVNNSIIIDESFALFLGYFMGDGSYSGDTLSVVFDKKDQNSIEVVNDLIYKLFNRKMQRRQVSENGIELRVGIKELKSLFYALGIIEQKSYGIRRKVCVPDCIWKSPKSVITEFLKGLFDADGFAAKVSANVKFFSKHPNFVRDVQLLLLTFGITSRRSHIEKKSGNGGTYIGNELALRASEARLYCKLIGFVSDRKINRTLKWINPSLFGLHAKKISLIDSVKKITYLGKQLVYDMEMHSEDHVFDAQGFVVHNCTSTEAFLTSGEDSYIQPDLVAKARKTHSEKYGPIVVGVDPARFGNDRTAIIRRQGRVAYDLETYIKKDVMEVTGLVNQIIVNESPAKVCIDVGGMGAGVYDRLVELGYKDIVVAVNFGSKPLDAKRFTSKRAEMWGLTKEWLCDYPAQIPDNNELHADLCNTRYTIDSNSRLKIERKEDMKKRGIRSPDCADALILTHALPPSALALDKKKDSTVAKSIMSVQNRVASMRLGKR